MRGLAVTVKVRHIARTRYGCVLFRSPVYARLPIPAARDAKTATGVDLSHRSMQWLYDECPADVARICEYFPYAMVPIKQREFLGGQE